MVVVGNAFERIEKNTSQDKSLISKSPSVERSMLTCLISLTPYQGRLVPFQLDALLSNEALTFPTSSRWKARVCVPPTEESVTMLASKTP